MTHPRIARLEIDAALAEERAKYKRVSANIAVLEEQAKLAGTQVVLRSTVSGFTYFVAVLLVAFVAWAYVTTPPDVRGAGAAASESHDTAGRKASRARADTRRALSAPWLDSVPQPSAADAQAGTGLDP
ncbi:MAG TPA: hypothetical protein VJV78_32405 [Polyangiales bacterium]|nr:hypothetical protein [Polyangiales bacterium]